MTRTLLAFILFFVLSLQLVADDSEPGVAAYNRGVEALDKKDYDKAIQEFTEAIRLDPKQVNGFIYRGIAYSNKQNLDKAIDDFTEAIRLDAQMANAFYWRGTSYSKKKQFDKAIDDFTEAIRLDPKSANAFWGRGKAYASKHDDDKAIDDFTKAIRLDPKNASTFYERGVGNASKHDDDKAIDDFTKAIRLDPKYPNAYGYLAWLLATCPKEKLRDGKRAVKLATKACELTESKVAVHLATLAAAYAECGDFKEAVKWQKKAIELDIDNEHAQKRLKLYEDGKPYRYE